MLLNFEWFLNVQDGKQCAKSLCASTTFQHGKEAPYLKVNSGRKEVALDALHLYPKS